jgi:hypothetical protein
MHGSIWALEKEWDIGFRGFTAEEFEQEFDRVAEAADAGLPWQMSGELVIRLSRSAADMLKAYRR